MPPLFAITLLSAAALGYEILLLHLFSVIQLHNFAYMIISIALLGYGASGSFLAFTRNWTQQGFATPFAINAVLFGFSVIVCFPLVQHIPFNPLELLWTWQQLFYLSMMYLLLAVPFFFAANGIGLSFCYFRANMGGIYSADLLGAGLGTLGIMWLLFLLAPLDALKIIGLLGLVAATLALWQGEPSPLWRKKIEQRRAREGGGWLAIMLLAAAALVMLFKLLATPWGSLHLSPYKGLSQALQVSGAQILQEKSSPLGLLTVVESPKVPFRYAPGLSINSSAVPPEQLGVFTNGDALTVINRFSGGEPDALSYLDFLTSALPYHLLERPKVLLLGAGGGTDVLQALYHKASPVDAVELNPQLVDLVRGDYAEFAGKLYDSEVRKNVKVHIAEARGFVAGSDSSYDLIQMALLDGFSASSAGLYALSESNFYTVEALEEFFAHLNPDGLLAITRWVKLPPLDALKLFASAVVALENAGVKAPSKHLALIRSRNTSTLLIKNGSFTVADLANLRRFCDDRSFDVAYYPGISPTEPNQYNFLSRPYFYEGASALLGAERDDFISSYKYDISPAIDDRPYFFNFFRWQLLPELFSKQGSGGMGLLEWGYPVLIVTLVQAAVLSVLFILLPLLFIKRRQEKRRIRLWKQKRTWRQSKQKMKVFLYFLVLGLAFLFIEIAFIQKFTLFLSHPLYAVTVVLSAFLIFAGLGSRYSGSLRSRVKGRVLNPSFYAIGFIMVLVLLYLIFLSHLFQWFIAWSYFAKVLISVLLIAPLAFWMGMPFPLGLARLGKKAPHLIPWAWGINGCASVLSAVLALVLAVHFGFVMVIVLALGLYGVAALAYP